MKDTIRTFIAIKVVPERKFLEVINQFKKSFFDEEIRWVDIHNLHVTLHFLGETNKKQVEEICMTLEQLPQLFQPFQFTLHGTGYFKRKNQPRVLYVSIKNDSTLKQLADEIKSRIKPLGFDKEEKQFTPHLTIARFKYISDKEYFQTIVNRFSKTKFQNVNVSEVVFYQSILGSIGPTYNPIQVVKLNSI